MTQKLGCIALVVRDYDEAIRFYTHSLGFRLIEDTDLGDGKRWVRVRPPGSTGTELLLAEPSIPNRPAASATRPEAASSYFCTPTTSGVIIAMTARGVKFCRPPKRGIVRNGSCFRGSLRQQVGPVATERLAPRLRKACRANFLPRWVLRGG